MAKSHQKASFPDSSYPFDNSYQVEFHPTRCYFSECKEDRINFLIKCVDSDCQKWFCNKICTNGQKKGSHLFQHLKDELHNTIELNHQINSRFKNLRCSSCKTRNIFSLGYVTKKNSLMTQICA